jgi:hypothetical protein
LFTAYFLVEAVILPPNEIIGRDHGMDIVFGHDRDLAEKAAAPTQDFAQLVDEAR